MFDMLQVQRLLARQGQDAAGRADDDVGAVRLEDLFVLLNGHPPEEDGDLDGVHVLAEALVLLADLERQFSGVAQHQHRHLGKQKGTI